MNTTQRIAIFTITISMAACSFVKKSAVPAQATVTPAPSPAFPFLPASPLYGVPEPGEAELTAIREKNKEVSMQTLTDGYLLYTGACAGCHSAINIYSRPEERWPLIIDDMAQRASLTETQKQAVLKYVMAVKASQPKETNSK